MHKTIIFFSLVVSLAACGGGGSSSDSGSASSAGGPIESCASSISASGTTGTITSQCTFDTNVTILDANGQTITLALAANSSANFSFSGQLVTFGACQVPSQPVIEIIDSSNNTVDIFCST